MDATPFCNPRCGKQELRQLCTSILLAGFALGGLMDGILLHQILQWHHLLSEVKAPQLTDLRAQVLADGVFHALMYVALLAAVVLAIRKRRTLAMSNSRWLAGWCSIGFGSWHIFDAVADHWILQLHHIKMNSGSPIWWDIAWLIGLGLGPLFLGRFLVKRPPDINKSGGQGVATAVVILVATATSSMPGAFALSNSERDALIVALPGSDMPEVLATVDRLNASIVWVDRSGSVWKVHRRDNTKMSQTQFRRGVVVLLGRVGPGGCSI